MSKQSDSKPSELYLKGIYPVELVASATKNHEVEVRAKSRFLHMSNYSYEKRWIKPGEVLKVPAKLVWARRRQTPKGHR